MKKTDTKAILPLMISTTFLISLLCYGSQTGFGGQLASATNTKVVDGATDTIQLSAKEVKDGVYNWISGSNGASNPTIKAIVNSTNVIKIQNPTDTKHELIIDTGADVLPSVWAPRQAGRGGCGPGQRSARRPHQRPES